MRSRRGLFFARDLIGKPLHTFPDHARAPQFPRVNTSSFFNSLKLPSSSALQSCQLVEMVLSPSVPFQAVMVLTQGAKLATKTILLPVILPLIGTARPAHL